MNRRTFVKSVGFGVAAFMLPKSITKARMLGSGAANTDLPYRPPFLFILADDFGWSQLG